MDKKDLWWWSWNSILTDYGYKESPVWTSLVKIVTNIIPANKYGVGFLAFLDVLLILGMAYIIYKEFGFNVSLFSLIFFCTSYPPFFSWAGNSLLRLDWLFFLVLSVCMARSKKNIHAGAALSLSILVEPFTCLFMIPLVFKSLV